MAAAGNFSGTSLELTAADGRVVGRINRQLFRVRDALSVEVEPGEDAELVVAIAVSIDRLRQARGGG